LGTSVNNVPSLPANEVVVEGKGGEAKLQAPSSKLQKSSRIQAPML
jgi:hypothetical protein